jgi:hypothetical protein
MHSSPRTVRIVKRRLLGHTGLILLSEDRGGGLLWKVDKWLPDYTVSHHRRQSSSNNRAKMTTSHLMILKQLLKFAGINDTTKLTMGKMTAWECGYLQLHFSYNLYALLKK